MNRIQQVFQKRSKKVIPFFTAGYPRKEDTLGMVMAAESAGASMVEIGMPFSDPLADGPIIQQSSQIALNNGVTLEWIFHLVSEIRKQSDIPLALMGYVNPLLNFGFKDFIAQASALGVDGLIIPDLPPEEGREYVLMAKEKNISPILLVAPNTPSFRIKEISIMARDLLYCVSILGVTGASNSNKDKIDEYMVRVKENSICPFVVGFGIKSNKDVVNINRCAHGAVVGSAIMEKIKNSTNPAGIVSEYVEGLLDE